MPWRHFDEPKRALAARAGIRLGDREISGTAVPTALLTTIRAEARRQVGVEIARVTLTVPADYQIPDPRRAAMIAAAEAAGPRDTEPLDEPAAVLADLTLCRNRS